MRPENQPERLSVQQAAQPNQPTSLHAGGETELPAGGAGCSRLPEEAGHVPHTHQTQRNPAALGAPPRP